MITITHVIGADFLFHCFDVSKLCSALCVGACTGNIQVIKRQIPFGQEVNIGWSVIGMWHEMKSHTTFQTCSSYSPARINRVGVRDRANNSAKYDMSFTIYWDLADHSRYITSKRSEPKNSVGSEITVMNSMGLRSWENPVTLKLGLQHLDSIMSTVASQIISLTIVYSTVYSDADQNNYQSPASLAFVRGIHRGPVNSPHKWPVTRKMFPFHDVIMSIYIHVHFGRTLKLIWKQVLDLEFSNSDVNEMTGHQCYSAVTFQIHWWLTLTPADFSGPISAILAIQWNNSFIDKAVITRDLVNGACCCSIPSDQCQVAIHRARQGSTGLGWNTKNWQVIVYLIRYGHCLICFVILYLHHSSERIEAAMRLHLFLIT